jgi:general secretion pathway protein D
VKTILLLFSVFLTSFGLLAQAPPAGATNNQRWDAVPPSGFSSLPSEPNPNSDTNRQAMLRQALLRALAGKTKSAAQPASPSAAAPVAAAATAATIAAPPNPVPAPARPENTAPPGSSPPNVTSPGGPAGPGAVAPAGPPAVVPAPAPGIAALPPAAATPATTAKPEPPEETLPPGVIKLKEADLDQVLALYAEWKNKTILRPTTLPAPHITLVTQTALTRKEALEALDVVLGMNGIGMIDMSDKFVKAVPLAETASAGQLWNKLPPDLLPNMGQYLTEVIQVTNVKPTDLIQVLQPFAKNPNAVMAIDASGILVLRDFTENVKRMLDMVRQIDVALPAEFTSEVIPIKYALASDIASALTSLSSGGGGTSVGAAAGGAGGARTTGGYGGRTGTGTSGFNRTGFGTGGYGQPGTTPFGQPGATPFGSTTPGAAGTTPGGAVGSSFTSRLQNLMNRVSAAGEFQILGQTKIIADERTNSLLVFAGRQDMQMIKDIIAKLDVVLAQVLIEAVIVQVSLDDQKNLGVSYIQHPQDVGHWTTAGALNNSSFTSKDVFGALTGSTTNIGGGIQGGFTYLATFGNDLDIAVKALQSSTKARILQRPRIQTSHAVPANIFVGENRPYPVSSYYGGGAYGGYASIQQLQIGVSLEVTPLINPDGLVVMDIHTKIDSFEGNVTIANVGDVPITSSKDATAKVAVKDHDTIMLGGLIETTKNANNSGLPFLKDVPLIGYLFRQSASDNSRNEMIVLIRPTVLPTPEVASLAAQAEKARMPGLRQFEAEMQHDEAERQRKADKVLKSNQFN